MTLGGPEHDKGLEQERDEMSLLPEATSWDAYPGMLASVTIQISTEAVSKGGTMRSRCMGLPTGVVVQPAIMCHRELVRDAHASAVEVARCQRA